MTIDFSPLPEPTELSAPFWSAGLEGVLRLQRCAACQHVRFPIDTICPRCLSPDYEWAPMSGRATVQTFIRFQRAYDPSWSERVPYVVALVELEEGPVMISNVVGEGALEVRVDDPVEVVFRIRNSQAALAQFQLTKKV